MFEDMGVGTLEERGEADGASRWWARSRLRSGALVGFVVEERGRMVASGVVRLQPVQPRPGRAATVRPYLMSVFAERDARGRGHAARLTRAAVAWCRREGHDRLVLHASAAGRGAYERLGFEPTSGMRLALPRRARRRERDTA